MIPPSPGWCKSEWWKIAGASMVVCMSRLKGRKGGKLKQFRRDEFYASNGVPNLLPNLFLNS
jgi:hypothetical protein